MSCWDCRLSRICLSRTRFQQYVLTVISEVVYQYLMPILSPFALKQTLIKWKVRNETMLPILSTWFQFNSSFKPKIPLVLSLLYFCETVNTFKFKNITELSCSNICILIQTVNINIGSLQPAGLMGSISYFTLLALK